MGGYHLTWAHECATQCLSGWSKTAVKSRLSELVRAVLSGAPNISTTYDIFAGSAVGLATT
jgi:hypothetical protein